MISSWNTPLLLLLAKATTILVAALGITLAMRRASAGTRHLVWLVTLGTLLLIPALTAWGPLRLHVLPPVPRAIPTTTLTTPDRGERAGRMFTGTPNPASPMPSTPAPRRAMSGLVPPLRDVDPLVVLLAVWSAVVVAIGASLAYASLAVRRIVGHGRALDTPDWRAPLYEVADRLGLDEPPRLLRSDEAKMPFACGVLRPTIVLPAECDSWSLDRRRAVLLHELAHIRRHDLAGHTLGRLTCAIYWFHPLVWTAAKRLRSESERACDDLALACGTRATDYAEHLLEIVTSVRRDSTPSVAMAMARRKEFEGRMLAILDPELRRGAPSRRQSAVLIASLALVSVAVGAAAPVPRTEPDPAGRTMAA
ncbi:MAG: M56 family metallopeptidase, partial [Gemmatimonadaceae bacterium]